MSKVYKAINAVQSELAKIGISKDKKAMGYKFRGIDDVYGALASLLAEHKLCVIPRVLEREWVERQTNNGKAMFYVTVKAEFDLVSSEDGTKHTAATYGEAMDTSDKATNKAMSAAYKYMAFQTFCIPVDGDNDTENNDHKPMPKVTPKSKDGMDEARLHYQAIKNTKNLKDFEATIQHKKSGELRLKLSEGNKEQQEVAKKIQDLIDVKRGELK